LDTLIVINIYIYIYIYTHIIYIYIPINSRRQVSSWTVSVLDTWKASCWVPRTTTHYYRLPWPTDVGGKTPTSVRWTLVDANLLTNAKTSGSGWLCVASLAAKVACRRPALLIAKHEIAWVDHCKYLGVSFLARSNLVVDVLSIKRKFYGALSGRSCRSW